MNRKRLLAAEEQRKAALQALFKAMLHQLMTGQLTINWRNFRHTESCQNQCPLDGIGDTKSKQQFSFWNERSSIA